MDGAVISSRALERAVLKRKLEEAATTVLGLGPEFVRLRGGGHWGSADEAADVVPRLPGAPDAPVLVQGLGEYLAGLEGRADRQALRHLERVLRSNLSRVRVYRAGPVTWVLGHSPVAGRAGLRIGDRRAP